MTERQNEPQCVRDGYSTVLITGSEGFCGQHLIHCLVNSEYEVAGLDRILSPSTSIVYHSGDVTDESDVRCVLTTVQPVFIFHLAALTNARLDYRALQHVNVLGTLSLLNIARALRPPSSVVVTSSSAVYGHVSPDALPISEDHPFAPTNFYAVSKVAQEMVAYQHFAQYKLRVIRTRAFNLTGPGESSRFVTSAFARQIAEIEAGLREPAICVGNLDAVRDFTDVRDAVRAYKVLGEQGVSGEAYNVCSGQGTSIRDILNTLLDLSTQRNINVQIDPSRLQPADVPIQIGDASKLRALTGWTPAIPLRQTLEDVLNYWRKQVKEEST